MINVLINDLNDILTDTILILHEYLELTAIRSIMKMKYELYAKTDKDIKLVTSFTVLKRVEDDVNYKREAKLRLLTLIKNGLLKGYE